MDSSLKPADNGHLDNVEKHIVNASKYLKEASQTLCNISEDNHIKSQDSYIHILKYAFIYKDKIFPFTKHVILKIQSFFEDYDQHYQTFEQFKTNIKAISNDAKDRQKLADFTKDLYSRLSGSFKSELRKLNNNKDLEALIQIMESFIQVFTSLAKFFQLLEADLILFVGNTDKDPNNLGQVHYKSCRNKAPSIIQHCRFYMEETIDCESDLLSIEYENDDSDWFDGWLKRNKITSYSSWCIKLSIT